MPEGTTLQALTLDGFEQRVLGSLLEKSLTQPDAYPMTLNALTAACNQKHNREPVMDLDEDVVRSTLEQLREKGLVSWVLPSGTSRVDKYRHEVETRLGWDKPQRAIMTELLLRGPQTAGELRTRASRMYPFESLDVVSAVLDSLGRLDPPVARPLPRVPGQSATRYVHLLGDGPAAQVGEVAGHNVPHASPPTSRSDHDLSSLAARVEALEQSVTALQAELSRLRQGAG